MGAQQNWTGEQEVAGSQSQSQSQRSRHESDNKRERPVPSDEFKSDHPERNSFDQNVSPEPLPSEKAVRKDRDGMTPEVSPDNDGFRSSEDH